MNSKYSNACKEVLVLFDYFLEESDLNKIPKEQMEYLKKNANHNYNYMIDTAKNLEDQDVSKEAKAIIISLYKKYFITSDKKKKVDEILELIDKQKKIKLANKTRSTSLEEAFCYNKKNEFQKEIDVNTKSTEQSLIKSESWWRKFINKILKKY